MASTDINVTEKDATITLTAPNGMALSGTVVTGTGAKTIAGTDTLFDVELKVGDTINVVGESANIVDVVTDDLTATAVDDFIGVSGALATASKTITCVLNADLEVGRNQGFVECVGSDRREITSGKKTATGTLTYVTGKKTDDIQGMFIKGTVLTVTFDLGNGGSLALTGGKITGTPFTIDGGSADAISWALPVVFTDYSYTS